MLNQEVGVRRLNVAVTRSRQRMTVVSSFAPTALEPSDRVNGTEMLRRFLEMLPKELDPRDIGRATGRPLNGFEEDIMRRLTDAGLAVHPQWGVSEYVIDLAVAHPERPGDLVLAVEADGDRYHRAKVARDRDRLRQEHLERLGWRFHRVWASAWFNDPETEARKIVDAWQRAVHDSDARTAAVEPAIVASAPPNAPAPEPADRRGAPHHVPPGFPTSKYTDGQLIAVCRWLISDGLALDREIRLHQAKAELGFKVLGPKLRERLTRAVDIAQHQVDQAEG